MGKARRACETMVCAAYQLRCCSVWCPHFTSTSWAPFDWSRNAVRNRLLHYNREISHRCESMEYAVHSRDRKSRVSAYVESEASRMIDNSTSPVEIELNGYTHSASAPAATASNNSAQS